jgi:hypothetical protein
MYTPVVVLVLMICWKKLAERAQEHGYSNRGGASGDGEVEVAKALKPAI